MKLGQKVVFYILITCILPLMVLAWASRDLARSWLEAIVVSGQTRGAETLAIAVAHQVSESQRILGVQMSSFRLETVPDEARTAFLIATFRLVEDIDIAALVDKDGGLLVPAVSEGIDGGVIEAFLRSAPTSPGFGTPVPIDANRWAIPMAIPSPYGDDCVLLVRLSLGSIQQQINTLVEGEGIRAAALVDRAGNILLISGQSSLVDMERIRPFLQTGSVSMRYPDKGGDTILAATAPAGELAVIVAEPAGLVAEATGRLESQSWFILGVALIAALAMGMFLTRSLTDPVQSLREAVRQFGQGKLDARIKVEGSDEIADLGRAFNEMATSLARSNTELASKNAEIERFNQELQHRVEERTRELRMAQARLVQSQQLAAVAEVTSGVAHELNNPLAGILGILQVLAQLRHNTSDAALLKAAEEQALRCREILSTLTRFARPQTSNPGSEVEIDQLVADALVLVGGALTSRGVHVQTEGLSDLVVIGESTRLFQAFAQILGALKGLAQPGAILLIEGSHRRDHRSENRGDLVEIRISISGTAATADDWQAAGLGFWAARQVLEEQGVTFTEGEDTLPPSRSDSMGGPRRWTLRFRGPA